MTNFLFVLKNFRFHKFSFSQILALTNFRFFVSHFRKMVRLSLLVRQGTFNLKMKGLSLIQIRKLLMNMMNEDGIGGPTKSICKFWRYYPTNDHVKAKMEARK